MFVTTANILWSVVVTHPCISLCGYGCITILLYQTLLPLCTYERSATSILGECYGYKLLNFSFILPINIRTLDYY